MGLTVREAIVVETLHHVFWIERWKIARMEDYPDRRTAMEAAEL